MENKGRACTIKTLKYVLATENQVLLTINE